MKSPLNRFTGFYFLLGLAIIAVGAALFDPVVALFVAMNWLAAGIGLLLIAYGLPRKAENDMAGLIYWLGVAWLVLLFAGGLFLIGNDGIGVRELGWLVGRD